MAGRRRLRSASAILIASLLSVTAMNLGAPPSQAWTQWATPDGYTQCGILLSRPDCLKYPKDYTVYFKFSSIFRNDFKPYARTAAAKWNNEPYRHPTMVENAGAPGITFSAFSRDPNNPCGKANPVRDPYHVIAGSTNPERNSNWVAWTQSGVSYSNDIYYDQNWTGQPNHCDINTTFLHEVGHVIGPLSHEVDDPNAIMYPRDGLRHGLGADDRGALQVMYGGCAGC